MIYEELIIFLNTAFGKTIDINKVVNYFCLLEGTTLGNNKYEVTALSFSTNFPNNGLFKFTMKIGPNVVADGLFKMDFSQMTELNGLNYFMVTDRKAL